mmetsp:Transcript_93322/g.201876  ORF Transcript_93322/g.201876 Transcript_93322/m.201876 type:complete len:429 (+) Transcript_93322:67-1353(+)
MRLHAAHKVRRRDLVLVAGPVELPSGEVEAEDADPVRVLVRRDQPLARCVELEVPGRLAARVLRVGGAKQARLRALGVDPEDGDAVVASVGDQHVVPGGVDADAAAGVHLAGVAVGDRPHRLHDAQGMGLEVPGDQLLRGLLVEFEHRDLRGEFVDDVADGQRGVELDVARTQGLAALGPGHQGAGRLQLPRGRVEAELPDEVHAEIRDEGDSAEEGVEDHGVRVRVRLPLLLGGGVVDRVVHVLVRAHLHGPALVRIVHRAQLLDDAARRVDAEHGDGGIPVVDHEHVQARLVQRDVAGRGATGVGCPQEVHLPRVGVHGPRVDLAVLGHGLRAGVHDVLVRVEPRERRVHDALRGHREEHHLPVGRVDPEGVETLLRLLAARTVRQVVEARVARDDHELLAAHYGPHEGRLRCHRHGSRLQAQAWF